MSKPTNKTNIFVSILQALLLLAVFCGLFGIVLALELTRVR